MRNTTNNAETYVVGKFDLNIKKWDKDLILHSRICNNTVI